MTNSLSPYRYTDGVSLNLTKRVNPHNIIFDNTFENGMDGWCQLLTPSTTTVELGSVYIADRGSFSGNCIAIRTSDVSSTVRGGVSMGLKRSSQYFGAGKYLAEFWTSIWNNTSDVDRPRLYAWGLDTALQDGTRKFFEVRWLNYDEGLSQRVFKFQVHIGSSWVDVPNGTWDIPTNENKDLVFYLAMEVDLVAGTYEGIQIANLLKSGSLNPKPDNSIRNLGVVGTSSLPTFANGLNMTASVINRSNASFSGGRVDIHRARLSYSGG